MTNSISVCIVARNEERLLPHCLRSVKPIADEIVLVDTGSTDRTRDIARRFGARVVERAWNGSFAVVRNEYVRAASKSWILVIDADESIARRDLPMIKRAVRRRSRIGYRLVVRNYSDEYDVMWRWEGNTGLYAREERFSSCAGWMKTEALRLFRRLPGVEYIESPSAHSTPLASLQRHPGRIDQCGAVIHHFQYLKGGAAFVASKQNVRLELELVQIRNCPGDPRSYLNAAKTLFTLGRDVYAARLLARAVRLDPSFHDGYQLWAMIDLQNGRLASAARRLRQALAIDPRSADAWMLLGMAAVERRRYDEARAALERSIVLRPNHPAAHNSLGLLFEDLGQTREARRAFRRALQIHPRFAPARDNLARVERVDGRRRRP